MIKKLKGFSLLEVVIALTVFAMINGALILLFQLSLKITTDDKAKNGALAIAQEKMETIKNLPYNDIGVVGAIPSGNLPAIETVNLNNDSYNVGTEIKYIDDPFDLLMTEGDSLGTDYKQIRIEVSWDSKINSSAVVLNTNIAPKNLEEATIEDAGSLKIEVYDSNSQAVSQAQISIVNNNVSPAISINSQTDGEGVYTLVGVPAATQSYEINISKSGYSSSQTYSQDLVNNPNPDPAHLSVEVNKLTSKTFFIDQLSTLSLIFKDNETENIISGFNFDLRGEKTIGTDSDEQPIYKYLQTFNSDSQGQVNLSDMEYDSYHINFDNSAAGYDIAGYELGLPIVLASNTAQTTTLYLAPHTDNSVFIAVKDSLNNILSDATVRLYNSEYDVSQNTNSRGQTFFSNLVAGDYNLEISKTDFITYNLEINVSAQIQQTIWLTPSS